MKCNKCGGKTSVNRTNGNPEYSVLRDFQADWILRERKCESCSGKMITAEVAIPNLRELSDMYKRQLTSEVANTRHFKGKYSKVMSALAEINIELGLYRGEDVESPYCNSK